MTTNKRSITRLVAIAVAKGIRYVVVSPGSRNAPIVIAFDEHPAITCINIPDERVAGFYALGMALQLGEPVILTCTSGSAVLNYAPALVEAYYLRVPLLVLTADRPPSWIDQNAGQTMRQRDVYQNFIKKSFELLSEAHSYNDIWYNDRMINEAIDQTLFFGAGPVHINIPFEEPLYLTRPDGGEDDHPRIISTCELQRLLTEKQRCALAESWKGSGKVLILVGQKKMDKDLDSVLFQLLKMNKVVLLSEVTSNIKCDSTSSSIDRLIAPITPEDFETLRPDILITLGGAVVSKRIRGLLQKMAPTEHWHIDPVDYYIDTYQSLSHNIVMDALTFFNQMSFSDSESDYSHSWEKLEKRTVGAHQSYLSEAPWSDLKVFEHVLAKLPADSILHLSNSTPIRYVQLFDQRKDIIYHANRGVSGIDGCTSTAAGMAFVCDKLVTLVTGDVAFFYDSNAFYHNHLPPNLRVIVINNEGGNIFRYIPGPSSTQQLEQHFESHHNHQAKGIAESYHVDYLSASSENELLAQLENLYSDARNKTAILEVLTPRIENAEILKAYFAYLANN